MENLGIKVTIYDFFAFFMTGTIFILCIILEIYFTKFQFSIPIGVILGNELTSFLPAWFLVIVLIFISYISGLLITTLSWLFIKKFVIDTVLSKSAISGHFKISNSVPENTYKIFHEKYNKNVGYQFNEGDKRFVLSAIRFNSTDAFNVAYTHKTISTTNRNLCLIFFLVGLVSIILNLCIPDVFLNNNSIRFGVILLIFSIISFIGYLRNYQYYLSQIVFMYINIKGI